MTPTRPLAERRKIKRNRCRCKKCGDVIESLHRHHCVKCSCGAAMTDGGLSYIRRGWSGGEFEDVIEPLDEYEPHLRLVRNDEEPKR